MQVMVAATWFCVLPAGHKEHGLKHCQGARMIHRSIFLFYFIFVALYIIIHRSMATVPGNHDRAVFHQARNCMGVSWVLASTMLMYN